MKMYFSIIMGQTLNFFFKSQFKDTLYIHCLKMWKKKYRNPQGAKATQLTQWYSEGKKSSNSKTKHIYLCYRITVNYMFCSEFYFSKDIYKGCSLMAWIFKAITNYLKKPTHYILHLQPWRTALCAESL